MDDVSNPLPVTVSVKADPPTEALDGFNDLINGTGPILGYEHADISSSHALSASTATQQSFVAGWRCILSVQYRKIFAALQCYSRQDERNGRV